SSRTRSSRKEDAPSMNTIQQPQIRVKDGTIISLGTIQEDSDLCTHSFDVQTEEKTATAIGKVLKLAASVEKAKIENLTGPEAHSEGITDEEEVKKALSHPPPVNSDYLPLPWKGRLGYVRYQRQQLNKYCLANIHKACLNTYLRQSNPPVFSSRTCRIAS